jgi:hypothetical protein
MTASPSWLEPSASSQQKQQPTWLEPHQPQPQEQKPSWLAQPRPLPTAGTQPPNHGSSGLYGQNPTVDVLADFNRNWVAGQGGVRPQFRSAVQGLIGRGYASASTTSIRAITSRRTIRTSKGARWTSTRLTASPSVAR